MGDFVVIPKEVMADSRLSPTELRVLIALFSFRGRDTNLIWPSLKTVAEIIGHSHIEHVSKTIKALSLKGWVVCMGKAFGGSNRYQLTVPMLANTESPILAEVANIEEVANVDGVGLANVGESGQYNIGETRQPKIPSKKPIEDTNKNTKRKNTSSLITEIEMIEALPGLSEEVASDYIAYRKRKKVDLSASVWKAQSKTLITASEQLGMSVDDLLVEVMEADWRGIKVQWLENRLTPNKPAGGIQNGTHQPANGKSAIDWDDASWANGFSEAL
jgi:hypothetical protein